MGRRKIFLILSLGLSLISSCRTREKVNILSTPTLYIITATLAPTLTPLPTYPQQPPSPNPTISPVEGTTTTQINVRSLPYISADVLGQLGIFTKVEITGRDSIGDWYRINYSPVTELTSAPQNVTGIGWITSEYVQVEGEVAIPVIPNIYSGPTEPTNPSSTQISQIPLANGIQSSQPYPAAAIEDGDSAQNPVVDIDFSPTSARSITYAGDVSSPQGDLVDWIRFKPYIQSNGPSAVSIVIKCDGNIGLNIELQQASQVLQTWENIFCKSPARLLLDLYSTAPYVIRISLEAINAGLNHVNYVITVQQDS